MNIVYSREYPVSFPERSIFLAGPTPRDNKIYSWRPKAIEYFLQENFDGTIIYPEERTGYFNSHHYKDQVNWEEKMMDCATIILFWIPRNMENMPALTTNIEFGKYMNSGKIVVGLPCWADSISYIEYTARKRGIWVFDNLFATVKASIEILNKLRGKMDD